MSRRDRPAGETVDPVEIVHRFRGRLRVFAAHRLNDEAEAEDVAQEALRCILEAIQAGRVRDLNALPGFVFQTARNICLKKLRGEARRERAMERHSSGHDDAVDRDPLLALIDQERRAQVRQALFELGSADRELLQWLYSEGVSVEEAARRLGLTDGAVRVRKHRALRRLGRYLGESRYGEID